ncbi:MAG: DUF6273 domain-containing protein [Micrococcales bacterium]|nr:DUF6273 domain-containing protein [Micrococcales bacterium]
MAERHDQDWLVTGDLVLLSGIDWRVIDQATDESGRRVLLLADRVIGTGPYHKTQVAVTWQGCDLRHWLNDEFFRSLGDPLTSRVLKVPVQNGPSPTWGTRGGSDTQDQVFLLSTEEAASLLAGKREVRWNKYKERWFTDKKLVARDKKGLPSMWWLRSPGCLPDLAACVTSDGGITDNGNNVSTSSGVRPALWLDLEL